MEEDIKILENIIYNDEGKKMSYVDVNYKEGEEFIDAIINLIARNKELEQYKKDAELTKITCCVAQNCEALNNCIRLQRENENLKSKIKEKIEELEGRFFGYKMLFTDEQLIEDEKRLLQELLED